MSFPAEFRADSPRRRPGPLAALALVATALLAGCASQSTKVTSQWAPDVTHDKTYTRVLVIGVTPNYNQRCAFEWSLASEIKSDKVKVLASCDALTSKIELTRENVEKLVRERQIDAVVATTLVAYGFGIKEGGERDDRGSGAYKATGSGWGYWGGGSYYGAWGVPVVYGDFVTSPSITTLQGEISILTRVFDGRDAKPVYVVETHAKNLENRDEALIALTPPIATRLRADGLIR
jgi:hypothetical protein